MPSSADVGLKPYQHYFSHLDPSLVQLLIHANRLGYSIVDQSFCIRRDGDYPYFAVHIVMDVCGFFHIAGNDYLLKKGDAFVICAGEAHLYKNNSAEPLTLAWAEFSTTGSREIFQRFRQYPTPVIDGAYTDKAQKSLCQIVKAVQEHSYESEYALSAMYYGFLMDLLEAASMIGAPVMPQIVDDALRYITRHLGESFQVKDLAEALHISHTYLTKVFRRYTGVSPMQYIHMKRLEQASKLLADTALTCEEIAGMVGFYDAAHFSHLFLRNFGCTPSDYRKQKNPKNSKADGEAITVHSV